MIGFFPPPFSKLFQIDERKLKPSPEIHDGVLAECVYLPSCVFARVCVCVCVCEGV